MLLDDGLADLIATVTGAQALSAEQLCGHPLARYADSNDDDMPCSRLRLPDSATVRGDHRAGRRGSGSRSRDTDRCTAESRRATRS